MEASKKEATMDKPTAIKLANQEWIDKLQASSDRQVKRAKQVSDRKLVEKLAELKASNGSDAEIAAAKQESADALTERLAAIQKRVQARIKQLKE